MNLKNGTSTLLNRWITAGSFALIIIGTLLIYLSQQQGIAGSWQDILLGIGLGLTPSGIVGFLADWLVFGRLIDALHTSTDNLGAKTDSLGAEISSLRVSTDFLKQSSELGLEMIHTDRAAALREFAKYMDEEARRPDAKGNLIIVGSSVKGLIENIKEMPGIIAEALKSGCKLRILVTHPKYSRYRENQEDRSTGAIEDEIFRGIRILESSVEADFPDPPDRKLFPVVRFYKGTPTCFVIIAGDRMLINPYPYEEEAYKSFCIVVRRVELIDRSADVERTIYSQYLRAHFDKPWRRNAVPYRHFWLEGPNPKEAWDRNSCYGDVFVVQDASHFYLAVNLLGQRKAEVRGMPTSIPCSEINDQNGYLELPDKFSVRLFEIRTNTWRSLDEEVEYLSLHPERRRGKLSFEVYGNLLNDYLFLGLFDPTNKVINPNLHSETEIESLREQPLPLFYVRLNDKHVELDRSIESSTQLG